MPAKTKAATLKPMTDAQRHQVGEALRALMEAMTPRPTGLEAKIEEHLSGRRAAIDAAVDKLRPHAKASNIRWHRTQARELRATARIQDREMRRTADEHEAIADLLQALRPKRGR